ncbi:HAD-IC family P-type ATPase [Granulicella aggregans]|uniref:HAD-IC family P-type ATPase n=1 Tax=Granulicella aggregans TaxID=474949 RepID=UPI00295BD7A5|nr:HAD-IC family P-type ATPase [Granulicella aggregans]
MRANTTNPSSISAPPGDPQTNSMPAGLRGEEASNRLQKDGPNAMPDISAHPLRDVLANFWAPVPWLLELAIVLQTVLHKYLEAAVIAGLLIFNAALAYFQEGRAQATLAALKHRLALNASVRRDGVWKTIPAVQVVCGDLIKLSLGGVVAADVHLLDGSLQLDQSMVTGESLPVEAGAGFDTYAGALVRRGEATAQVTATGDRTKFGRTAELVRTAHVVSSQQRAVLQIVRNLAYFNAAVILLIGTYAYFHAMPGSEIVPLLLTSVLAAIPVALPATFTLAAAIGARSLAKLGVLPTRLSAVDEAATIDTLCCDKTGTLTANQLSVSSVRPMEGFDEAHVLGLAALASSDGGQDSVDKAIRSAAGAKAITDAPKLTNFIPFDPATKISEAEAVDVKGNQQRIIKGAFSVVSSLTSATPAAVGIADDLEKEGFRVLAVAVGTNGSIKIVGFIALSDPPRSDSRNLIAQLKDLGVRTVMVTGDAPQTAMIVAHEVGLEGPVCPPGAIPDAVKPTDFAVFAGILPEGKFTLLKDFQKGGHTIGMCGDGANDAPALRQAQIGIAVSTATDVAKSAAGVVLTEAGLGGIVAAVKEGRVTFQRILTYTLNSVIKKIVQVLLLAIGLIMTGHAVLTPLLMVIVMITGDFLAMSLTTDRVRPSAMPNSWHVGKITGAAVLLGLCLLAFCVGVVAIGKFQLRLGIESLRTLAVVAVVYGSQVTIYALRARRHMWGLRPTRWLVLSSVADLAIITLLAQRGILMAPLSPSILGCEFVAAALFGLILDAIKIPILSKFGID